MPEILQSRHKLGNFAARGGRGTEMVRLVAFVPLVEVASTKGFRIKFKMSGFLVKHDSISSPKSFMISADSSHLCPQRLEGVLSSADEPCLGGFPVDHRPDVIDVGGFPVEILQVVSVLPHVDTKDGRVAHDDGLLVGQRHNPQLAGDGLPDEPAPAAALDAQQGGRERLLEALEAPPRSRDRCR